MEANEIHAFIKALECHEYGQATKILSCSNDGFDESRGNLLRRTGRTNRTVWHHLCRACPDDNQEEKLILELASNLLSVSSKDDFTVKDSNGFTPLHSLLNHLNTRNLSLVHLILDHFRSRGALQDLLVTSKDNFGRSPLHYLARNRHLEASFYETVLGECSHSSSTRPVTDNESKTPLHFAAATFQSSSVNIMRLWIQYAPSAVIMYDWRGWLAIDFLLHAYGFYHVRVATSQPHPKQPSTVTNHNCLYYCRLKRRRLTTKLEQRICQDLWPKMQLFLKATYQALIMEEEKKIQWRIPTLLISNDEKETKSMTDVHFAASCQSLPVIVLVCANINNPKAVFKPTINQGYLPLHLAATAFQAMIPPPKNSIYEDLYNSRWSNCFDYEIFSKTSLQSHTHSREYICSHSMIQYLLELNKEAATVWTREGQLPLHLACIHGKSWNDIKLLLLASPETICCQDGPTLLYPFMLAALNGNNTLNVVFELLVFNPELVSVKS